MLPQAHCRLHVDEAGVFAELPVRVVGDPSLPVIGVNHFPRRKDREVTVVTDKPASNEENKCPCHSHRSEGMPVHAFTAAAFYAFIRGNETEMRCNIRFLKDLVYLHRQPIFMTV